MSTFSWVMTHEIVDMTAACISRLRDAGRVEQTKFTIVPIWETVLLSPYSLAQNTQILPPIACALHSSLPMPNTIHPSCKRARGHPAPNTLSNGLGIEG